jgi:hypothetical protein
MIRPTGVAVTAAAVGIGLAFASGPPASADHYDQFYEDFGVAVADRPFFDWLVDDGNYVLYPPGTKTEGSFKPLLRLGNDTCGLVDRIGFDGAFDFVVTTPMPGQSRPMTRDQANRWLNGAVPNLCPELF